MIMSHVCVTSQFDRDKARVIDKADLSRKGSVDAPIRSLVDCINSCKDFYTTSSCSGRAIVFCEDGDRRKKGCHWLLVSHDPISCGELMDTCDKATVLKRDLVQYLVSEGNDVQYPVDEGSGVQYPIDEGSGVKYPVNEESGVQHPVDDGSGLKHPVDDDSGLKRLVEGSRIDQGSDMGYTFFKFEPFVLHMMCRSMEKAQTALQIAVGSGFRNSGITCGKKGKIMLAVRSTHSLEVPLCHNGLLLVSKEYLSHLVELCNRKFTENSQRIERFFHQLKASIEQSQNLATRIARPKDPVNKRVHKEATKVDKEVSSCHRDSTDIKQSTHTDRAESNCGNSSGELSFEKLFDPSNH